MCSGVFSEVLGSRDTKVDTQPLLFVGLAKVLGGGVLFGAWFGFN